MTAFGWATLSQTHYVQLQTPPPHISPSARCALSCSEEEIWNQSSLFSSLLQVSVSLIMSPKLLSFSAELQHNVCPVVTGQWKKPLIQTRTHGVLVLEHHPDEVPCLHPVYHGKVNTRNTRNRLRNYPVPNTGDLSAQTHLIQPTCYLPNQTSQTRQYYTTYSLSCCCYI